MTRYRLVNGKRKKFTKAEETARDKEEEQALLEKENAIQEQETKQAKKESGRQKLKDLGLDDDEIDALIN
jgi:hypothetical protein